MSFEAGLTTCIPNLPAQKRRTRFETSWRNPRYVCSVWPPHDSFTNVYQDWLYEDGDDATKAQYVAKIDEIRFVAGPVVQRYQDKIEQERQALLKAQEEEAAKKRAEAEAKKKAEEEAKKAAQPPPPEDTEMKDADGEAVRPDSVEEK